MTPSTDGPESSHDSAACIDACTDARFEEEDGAPSVAVKCRGRVCAREWPSVRPNPPEEHCLAAQSENHTGTGSV